MINSLFDGNLFTTYSGLAIWIAVFSLWIINKNLNGDQRLFEMVPVSRRFTVFNVFLASLFIVAIIYFGAFLVVMVFVNLIIGGTIILSPQNIPVEIVPAEQLTVAANVFMLLLLVIIIFVGTAIALIKNGKYRNGAYAAFFLLGYALLSFLKRQMPVSPNTGKVEFLESFSLMPQINQVLTGFGIAVLLIVPLSVYAGYSMYCKGVKPS